MCFPSRALAHAGDPIMYLPPTHARRIFGSEWEGELRNTPVHGSPRVYVWTRGSLSQRRALHGFFLSSLCVASRSLVYDPGGRERECDWIWLKCFVIKKSLATRFVYRSASIKRVNNMAVFFRGQFCRYRLRIRNSKKKESEKLLFIHPL